MNNQTENQAMEAAEAALQEQAKRQCFAAMRASLETASAKDKDTISKAIAVVGVTHDEWLDSMVGIMTAALFQIEMPEEPAAETGYSANIERHFGKPSAALSFDEFGQPKSKTTLNYERGEIIFAVHGGTTIACDGGAALTLIDDTFVAVKPDSMHMFFNAETIEQVNAAFAAKAAESKQSLGLRLVTKPL